MNPVRTKQSNFVYKGPTANIGDAWTEVKDDTVYMVWELSDEERRFLLDGGNIKLGIHFMGPNVGRPIPPVSLMCVGDQPVEPPEWKTVKAGWQPSWKDEQERLSNG